MDSGPSLLGIVPSVSNRCLSKRHRRFSPLFKRLGEADVCNGGNEWEPLRRIFGSGEGRVIASLSAHLAMGVEAQLGR